MANMKDGLFSFFLCELVTLITKLRRTCGCHQLGMKCVCVCCLNWDVSNVSTKVKRLKKVILSKECVVCDACRGNTSLPLLTRSNWNVFLLLITANYLQTWNLSYGSTIMPVSASVLCFVKNESSRKLSKLFKLEAYRISSLSSVKQLY